MSQNNNQKNSNIDQGKTPEYLIPKMGNDNVVETAFYETLHITSLPDSTDDLKEITEAQDPFSAPTQETPQSIAGATQPAEGVLLIHKQTWKQKGLSLGTLLSSLCLAPGEATKVALIDWRKRTTAGASESIGEDERLENEAAQNRAINEVQQSVAREAMYGRSRSKGSSSTKEVGASGSFFGIGGSAGSSETETESRTVSMSVGTRNMAASATQDIHQRTMEVSQASRSRRATIVKEINESGSEQLTTRVVVNYNHMHAMTIQYYEILQNYIVTSQVADAKRVIFIPMQVINFDKASVDLHLESLLSIAQDYNISTIQYVLERENRKDKVDEKNELEVLEGAVDTAQQHLDRHRGELEKSIESMYSAIETWKSGNIVTGGDLDAMTTYLNRVDYLVKKLPIEENEMKTADVNYYEYSRHMYAAKNNKSITLPKIMISPFLAMLKLSNALKKKIEAYDIAYAAAQIKGSRLYKILNRDRLFYSQQIWLRMDEHQVYMMMQGKSYKGEALFGRVDPRPVGVFSNYVAYTWNFQSQKDETDSKATAQSDTIEKAFYSSLGLPVNSETKAGLEEMDCTEHCSEVAISSDGLFAEAVLGQSVAAEKIDLTRFWNWKESPIPILPPDIAALKSGASAGSGIDVAPGQLSNPVVKLFGSQPMPDPTKLSAMVESLSNSDVFKDMSGKEAAAEISKILAQTSASSASHSADNALAAYQSMLQAATDIAGAADTSVIGGLLNVNPDLIKAKPE